MLLFNFFFFFSSRRRHTRWNCDWSSDVCSSDLHFYEDLKKYTRRERADVAARVLLQVFVKMILIAHGVLSLRLLLRRRFRRRPVVEYTGSDRHAPTLRGRSEERR